MELIHIQKTYHNRNNTVHALKGIDLDLSTNGIIVILGPSGCGKTTLLNIMAGRLSYEGRIEDVPSFDYLTQEFNLFENMSVKDNLLLVSENREKLDFYLDVFDMSDQMDKKVKKLSNGQKKRVQFIRALLHQPGLLLCDEPTAALDRDNAVKLMDELKKLSDEEAKMRDADYHYNPDLFVDSFFKDWYSVLYHKNHRRCPVIIEHPGLYKIMS